MSHKYLRDEDFENKKMSEPNFNLSEFLIKTEGNKGYYICEGKIKEFIQTLMKQLDNHIIALNKLDFAQTLITIKRLAGDKLA